MVSYVKLVAMNASEAKGPGDSQLRFARILWAALAGSVALYFVAALLIKPVAVVENATVDRFLIAVAVAYVAVSVPVKRWLLIQAEEVDSALLRRLAMVVPLILCEAAALTGIVLWLLLGSPHYYIFLLLSLAGFALHFPRPRQS